MSGRPSDQQLRPLPIFLVWADGDLVPGSYNVFEDMRELYKETRPRQCCMRTENASTTAAPPPRRPC